MNTPAHYCIMPFVSLRVEDDKNKNSMGIRPCCHYTNHAGDKFDNVDDYLNSDFLKNLQTQFLEGTELPKGCGVCKRKEDMSRPSTRTLNFKFFGKIVETKTNIRELDLLPSNTCNLTCYMCSPKFSSSVAAEYKKIGWIDSIHNFDKTDLVCDAISKFSGLDQIAIGGGEVFYLKNTTRLLTALVNSKAKRVRMFTNATVVKPEYISLLQKIPLLELRLSIDATGDLYEFIRYPANWQTVKDNLRIIKESLTNANLIMVPVIGPINVFGVFELIKLSQELDIPLMTFDIMTDYYGWNILTEQEKDSVKTFLLANIKTNNLTDYQKASLMGYLVSTFNKVKFDPEARQTAVSRLATMCRIRKINSDTINKIFKDLPLLGQEIIGNIA